MAWRIVQRLRGRTVDVAVIHPVEWRPGHLGLLLAGACCSSSASVPIAFALGLGESGVPVVTGTPLSSITQVGVTGLDAYPLLAIPLFIMAGEVMNTGGVAGPYRRASRPRGSAISPAGWPTWPVSSRTW